MSSFPTAQISKILDPKSGKTRGYQVAVLSDDAAPFAPGSFRSLRSTFRHGCRNLVPAETQQILREALKVAGPVKITVGWWIQSIDRS